MSSNDATFLTMQEDASGQTYSSEIITRSLRTIKLTFLQLCYVNLF
jgi:hypothetical protein